MRNRPCAGRWLQAGLVAAMACLAAGCGGPKTYPVKGTVVFADGDLKQLVRGEVYFASVADPKLFGTAEILEDGTFTAFTMTEASRDYAGLIAGEHRVAVHPPERSDDEGPAIIAARYRSPDTSNITITVPLEGEFVIKVSRR